MELRFLDPDVNADPLHESEIDLRYRVLRAPLGIPREGVGFAGEERALHLVAVEAGAVVGCVLFDFRSGRLRAMAVDPAWQGRGVGARLVRHLEAELRARGVTQVQLHARAPVVGFYEALGYTTTGEPFLEVGIPHRGMTKPL